MRLYVELAKKSFQRQVAYRSATLAGFATNLFFGALRAAVMIAVFGARQTVAGYSLHDAITYTGITQALIGVTALWGWFEMVRSIKSGEVAADLSKPFDYYGFWLAQDIGRGLYQFLTRGVTMLIAYALLFGISFPATLEQWLLTLLSTCLVLLVSFGWRFVVSTSAFWVTDALGLARMAFFMSLFPSGFLVPIAFMPGWLQTICYATPFPSLIETPVAIYLGQAQGAAALGLIAVQAVWAIVLMGLGRLLAEAGRRKLTIQGG
ncbi:MAG TPA: ABC-2 family transporter protein [Anaerolineae bacterium]|nr:ABC-2 family transporter protein [Anaerolineae bacterium]